MNLNYEEQYNKIERTKEIIFYIISFTVWAAGLAVCIVCAPLTTSVNGGVALGFVILMIGTVMLFGARNKAHYRKGTEPAFLSDALFPEYVIVEDSDELTSSLSGFRKALGEFLSKSGITQNSKLQDYASQILWHSLALWKMRMDKLGISMGLISNRRAYTSKEGSVRKDEFFDGRYVVKDVSEEIDATRIYYRNNKEIGKLKDKEVAHYAILSAKEEGDDQVVCPNCGSVTTRNNLIDGCDYCNTKFTVEDLTSSIGSFGFRRDFITRYSKRENVRELVYPWIFIISMMPFVYFGFFGAFLYMDENVIARFFTGLLAAGLFGLFGWCVVKLNMVIIFPIIFAVGFKSEKRHKNLLCRAQGEQDREKRMADYVRKFDKNFSLNSFYGSVQNTISAIHFADNVNQINAFSEIDLSDYLKKYANVMDVDTISLFLDNYEVKDGLQRAKVRAQLLLHECNNSKIKTTPETIWIRLVKSAECKTQAVCGPSVLRCKSCGASLSLMDGKKCAYCGHELDMKQYEWTILEYNNYLPQVVD